MSASGTTALLAIQWRAQGRRVLVWVGALAAGMVGTAVSIAGLYDTPAKIRGYAAAVSEGDALAAINGRVEGIATLGGVVQNEFGFVAAFVMPLLGISLVARATRREEELGRSELVLAGRAHRCAPTVAALVRATLAVLVTTAAFAAGLAAAGVDVGGAVLYAASLGALALVFAGLAALLAQLVLHGRTVYALSLVVLVLAYVLRGVGDVTGTWLAWLSPLGWAEKAAPFGSQRWWTLLVPLTVGTVLAGAAVALAGRRDLGSAVVRGGAGPRRAAPWLRTELGLAVWVQRPTWLGWLAGSVLVAGMMGSLARQLRDAVSGNPMLSDVFATSGARPDDGVVATTQLYLAVIAAGFVVQAAGAVRAEEAAGRLEPRLAGTRSRWRWWGCHLAELVTGLVAVVVAGSAVLALTTAWSLGDAGSAGRVPVAGLTYLPAELVLAAVAIGLVAVRPRAYALAWAAFALTAAVALLGPALRLPRWVVDLAPTSHVGQPPVAGAQPASLVVLAAIALCLGVASAVAFRRRDVPAA